MTPPTIAPVLFELLLGWVVVAGEDDAGFGVDEELDGWTDELFAAGEEVVRLEEVVKLEEEAVGDINR